MCSSHRQRQIWSLPETVSRWSQPFRTSWQVSSAFSTWANQISASDVFDVSPEDGAVKLLIFRFFFFVSCNRCLPAHAQRHFLRPNQSLSDRCLHPGGERWENQDLPPSSCYSQGDWMILSHPPSLFLSVIKVKLMLCWGKMTKLPLQCWFFPYKGCTCSFFSRAILEKRKVLYWRDTFFCCLNWFCLCVGVTLTF